MRILKSKSRTKNSGGVHSAVRTFASDKRGTTALEFGIVAMPFMMFAFGIMGTGLHFFTQNALEHAVETTARKIRTGQAQQGGTTVSQFKQMLVAEAGPMIDIGKLQVQMQTGNQWTDITPGSCVDAAGDAASGTGNDTDTLDQHGGGAGQVVLVTACYEWELAQILSFLQFDQLNNGSGMIQASTTFRTEPFE